MDDIRFMCGCYFIFVQYSFSFSFLGQLISSYFLVGLYIAEFFEL